MIYRHFFWDFDGTLYDTYGRITRAVKNALGDLGVKTDVETVYPLVKRMLRVAWEELAAPRGIGEDAFNAAYRAHTEDEGPETMRPFPGVREALAAVTAQGGQNFLYTHRDLRALDCFDRDGLTPFFTDWVTKENAFPLKPAPDALNYLIEKHGLDKTQCIMLGDRDIDLDAGKNAGIQCALFDPDHFYPNYPTPYRFSDMTTLRRTLMQ